MSSSFQSEIKKVIVGISGGVDSSVSAWLLQKKGYQVEGLFMKNWEDDDSQNFCSSASDLSDAYSVCDTLKIHLHTVNFSQEYWNEVFQIFLNEHHIGRTPNPDILCNKTIKFKYFLEFAREELNADFIATGHYVRLTNIKNQIYLMRGIDNNKDQSYFLCMLNQQQLKRCLFPLGTFTKSQVRNIAKNLNLITANKKNSTGICFIGKRKFKKFLSNYIPIKPGPIINIYGKKIGTHQGTPFYTLGQRTGLNIGGISGGINKPWYVADKNPIQNLLIAVQGINHPCLMSIIFITEKIHWITTMQNFSKLFPLYCSVKTRYRQPDTQCFVHPISNCEKFRIILRTPIIAVTPGQFAVFYSQEQCLGGGIISQRYPLIPTTYYVK